MGRGWLTSGLVALALVLGGGAISSAQAQKAEPSLQVAANSVKSGGKSRANARRGAKKNASSYQLGAGDKLRIVFYDREELSGERTIDDQGKITLPLFGEIDLIGKSTYELQKELKDKYLELAGLETYVTVEIVERRPFYVLGLVKKPGAYPFVPNLTVLQAVAISGGLMRQLPSDPMFLNYYHERMRMTQAAEELQKALARHARLEAQINDRTEIQMPRRLVELVGTAKARKLLKLEKDILDLEQKSVSTRLASLERTIKHDQAELTALGQRLKGLERLLKLQNRRLDKMRGLVKRNVVSNHGIVNTEREATATSSDIRQIMADRAKTQRLLEEHRRELAMLTVDKHLEAKRDKLEQQTLIERSEATLAAASEFVSQVAAVPMNSNPSINLARISYELVRGGKRFAVSDSFRMRPNDVLQVKMLQGTGAAEQSTSTGRMVPTSR